MRVLRTATAAEAAWTYLAHSFRFKKQVGPLVRLERLSANERAVLERDSFPSDMPPSLDVFVLADEVASGYGETIRNLQWELREITQEEIGTLFTFVSGFAGAERYGDGGRGTVRQLAEGWAAYLQAHSGEAATHKALVEELRSGNRIMEPLVAENREKDRKTIRASCNRSDAEIPPRIINGRHRLFAAFEAGIEVRVLWGRTNGTV